jgi:hypothetical protein
MAAYTRKQYSGAARNTTTTTLLSVSGTSVTIAATTGWPSTAGVPFYVVINPSSLTEEKCLATISGSVLTLTRAQDDTTASEHAIGSVIYPVFTANDADEANELVSKLTTKGDLLVTDGNGLYRLGVGADGYFLKANNSASVGVEWASIPTINNLNDVGDVTIVDAEEGDFLVYKASSSAWINQTLHFLTVSDTAPTDEIRVGDLWYNSSELELYTYYSGSWIQLTITPEFPKIEELDNVYADTANIGDVLVFDGLDWVNSEPFVGYYGSFYDTTTLSMTSSSTTYALPLSNTAEAVGASVVSGSRITVANAGVYNIQFSTQLDKTDSGSDLVNIWFSKNGVNIPYSNTQVYVTGGGGKYLASWNFVLTLAAGDYVQIMAQSPDVHMRVVASGAQSNPARPEVPSTIVTITQVR